MKKGEIHPIDAKKELATTVVAELHNEEAAKKAKENFEKTFQERKPEYSKEIDAEGTLAATIADEVGSMSRAKRLIEQGAVDIAGKTVTDPISRIKGGEEIKIGKKQFVKVKGT